MTDRFKVPPTAASESNAAGDDRRSIDDQLNEFEKLIRAIHAAGATIDDVRARLEPLLAAPDAIASTAPSQSGVPMGFPSPESNQHDPETRINACPDRESNPSNSGSSPSTGQSPFTRSSSAQAAEKTHKSYDAKPESCDWGTKVGHNCIPDVPVSLSNYTEKRPQQWVTRLGHKHSNRGLFLRGSIYQFRVRVPVNLREALGCSHLKRSLRTDCLSLAVRLSRKLASECEALFEQTRRESGLVYDERLLLPEFGSGAAPITILQRSEPAPRKGSVATLSEVYERFLLDPTKRRSDRTMLAHHTTRRVIEDVIGSAKPITDITREDCRNLLETLRWLPVNFRKKMGVMPVSEGARLAQADERIKTINPTNLNAYMARFTTLLNWAVAEEYIGRNPARGLQLAETVHPQDRRMPFEPWQLHRIFHAPIYTGCRDDQHGYAVTGNVIATGARYWIALISLMSGMRLNEAAQLDSTDVREIEGVQCFVITKASLVGSRDKTLKTKSSERLVPLHPILINLGLIDFVEKKRAGGALKLFHDLPPGASGFRSVAYSRWFSRFLVSVGAASPRSCFHSFRHGFRDAARNARIDRDIALRLGGWITGGAHSETADDYGAGYRPEVLFDAISAIDYSDLDLSHLLK